MIKKRSSQRRLVELVLSQKNQSPAASVLWARLLEEQGVALFDIIETREDTAVRVSTYCSSLVRARRLQKNLQNLSLKKMAVDIRTLYPTQWRDKWKKDFKPFALTPRLDIVPVWRKKEYHATSRTPILLDTVTAFGTGLHETTRFLSQLIESCRGKFKTFLDVGTGTGILTMVAVHNGASVLWAIDNDRSCIPVARANLHRNGIRPRVLRRIDVQKFLPPAPFDFVVANLTSADLIRCKRKLISLVRSGGYLACSGISLENFARLQKSFRVGSLSCRKILRGKAWVAVLYQRKANSG